MSGKCIKVESGIFFQLVIVFDASMNQEAVVVAQPPKVKQGLFDLMTFILKPQF